MKYNAFETLGGFYRQKSGLSMGGKMSSAMASIFVHMLEENIIQPHINKNSIMCYQRYVDDVFLIVKKGRKTKLLRQMNNFDKGLKWTIENMKNNKLVFLDTQVIVENSQLNLYQYQKPNSSRVLTNYKYGVSPKWSLQESHKFHFEIVVKRILKHISSVSKVQLRNVYDIDNVLET